MSELVFTCFPQLPLEIRLMIWELTFERSSNVIELRGGRRRADLEDEDQSPNYQFSLYTTYHTPKLPGPGSMWISHACWEASYVVHKKPRSRLEIMMQDPRLYPFQNDPSVRELPFDPKLDVVCLTGLRPSNTVSAIIKQCPEYAKKATSIAIQLSSRGHWVNRMDDFILLGAAQLEKLEEIVIVLGPSFDRYMVDDTPTFRGPPSHGSQRIRRYFCEAAFWSRMEKNFQQIKAEKKTEWTIPETRVVKYSDQLHLRDTAMPEMLLKTNGICAPWSIK